MPENEDSRDSTDRRSTSYFEGWLSLRDERRALAESRMSSFIGSTIVPFIPTSPETARKMLEVAQTSQNDVVCDLGCGDARLLILAVKLFGAKKAVGYEIRREVYLKALHEVETQNLREKVIIVNGDLFDADLSEATVITLYLTYEANKRLKAKLEREAKLGTRIVSHDFEMPDWRPAKKDWFQGNTIYLYIVSESLLQHELHSY